MINRTELKEQAKDSLKNIWAEAIKITLLLLGISFAIGFILGIIIYLLNIKQDSLMYDVITSIVELITSGLFTFGYLSFFVKVSRNEEVKCTELFSKTNMFITFIIASLIVGILTAVGFILLIIPGVIVALALSMTFYVLLDNPDMNILEALNKSNELTKGYKMDLFILILSFLGWIIVGIFTLGILYLWLIPYMSVTEANFYNKLKELKNDC